MLKKQIFKQIEWLTKLNVLIQTYYQRKENEIQNSTELHQLDTIEINYHINTNFYRRKFLEIKQKNLNVRHKIYEDKLNALDRELGQYIYTTIQKIENKRRDLLYKGLTPERIQKFHHYSADESDAGGQCSICIQEFEVGRKMMRLDCKHVFCKKCIEGWFADHKTCPNCRHLF